MSNERLSVALVEGDTLFYRHNGRDQQIQVGTPAWYAWLQTAKRFRVRCQFGIFSVRREQAGNKRGNWYWRAYRRHHGTLHRLYLGTTEELTPERLRTIALSLLTPSLPTRELQRLALPTPLTSLVGREQEIHAACRLLLHAATRILTLSGTGGVGKTRLALAIATRIQEHFPDGVHIISLAPLHDDALVLPAIVQALGLQGRGQPSLEVLQAGLREQHTLLVLDNFEQVIAAAPDLIRLLSACSDLKMLITSRERLHIRGEQELTIRPLTLPTEKHQIDQKTLANSSAVTLFLERAREVQPTFELTASNAPLIMEICCRLDGLPLALELAATRLKFLSPQDLLKRLEHRLDVLTGGARDLPVRQQTLRQTIAWSYELLSQDEQRLFRLLSVFVNGCTLEAAEEVYSRLGGERSRVLDGVMSLLDKHLLVQERQEGSTPRLLLHETLREFGLEALAAAQEEEAVHQIHAEYYLGLAEAGLEGTDLLIWLKRLEREYANLHTAFQWILERPTNSLSLRLGNALLHFREEKQERANLETGQRRILSLYLLGLIAWIFGDLATARLYTEEGLMRAKDADDQVTLAYLFDLSGQLALDRGEDDIARALLEKGLVLHQQANDIRGSLNSRFFLERILLSQGELTQARIYAEEHLVLSRKIQFRSGITGTLVFLGRLALEERDLARASDFFRECLSLLHETEENSLLSIATSLQGIGISLAKLGQTTRAVRLWGASEALCPLLPEERTFLKRASSQARIRLGEKAFAAAWAEGRMLTAEQSLAILERLAHPTTRAKEIHPSHPSPHNLTGREDEVLRLVAQGLSDAQIADTLIISPRTVNAHLRSIYMKLNISSRNAATYFALEHNLL